MIPGTYRHPRIEAWIKAMERPAYTSADSITPEAFFTCEQPEPVIHAAHDASGSSTTNTKALRIPD